MSVSITFLGGLGEIGRNSAAVEIEGKIALIDCGLMFPEEDMLGVDLVFPQHFGRLDLAGFRAKFLTAATVQQRPAELREIRKAAAGQQMGSFIRETLFRSLARRRK